MLKITKSSLGLAAIGLGAMLLVGTLIVSHNKYKTTEATLTSNPPLATATPKADSSATKKVTRLSVPAEDIIFINSEIDNSTVEAAIAKIQEAEASGQENLLIVLDCPGGSVFSGARLTSYMDASTVKIDTLVYGLAASMCGHIFEHGKTRYMIDHAGTLMMHQASGGLQGSVKNMKNLLNYLDKEVTRLDAYVADRSKLSRDEYDRLVSTDMWISGEDAISMGLADKLAVLNVEGKLFEQTPQAFNKNKTTGRGQVYDNPLKSFR